MRPLAKNPNLLLERFNPLGSESKWGKNVPRGITSSLEKALFIGHKHPGEILFLIPSCPENPAGKGLRRAQEVMEISGKSKGNVWFFIWDLILEEAAEVEKVFPNK